MTYPKVLSEDETLDLALAGKSIARYGDGELRLCLWGMARSQRPSDELRNELRDLLVTPTAALICIPNIQKTPRVHSWRPYTERQYTKLYKLPVYGSAFISRPDSAPWIDRTDYWDKVKRLWRGKNITLVWEDKPSADLSFTPEALSDAASVREVRGPALHAYAEIDRIEAEIGKPQGTVLLCLGATATILAARLANKGVHAIDIGHTGTFMRLGMERFKRAGKND